jgi:hypothetical protein
MVESQIVDVEQAIEEDYNLNIFKQVINTSEPMKKKFIKYLLFPILPNGLQRNLMSSSMVQ